MTEEPARARRRRTSGPSVASGLACRMAATVFSRPSPPTVVASMGCSQRTPTSAVGQTGDRCAKDCYRARPRNHGPGHQEPFVNGGRLSARHHHRDPWAVADREAPCAAKASGAAAAVRASAWAAHVRGLTIDHPVSLLSIGRLPTAGIDCARLFPSLDNAPEASGQTRDEVADVRVRPGSSTPGRPPSTMETAIGALIDGSVDAVGGGESATGMCRLNSPGFQRRATCRSWAPFAHANPSMCSIVPRPTSATPYGSARLQPCPCREIASTWTLATTLTSPHSSVCPTSGA